MEIVVTARHTEVSERFRRHLEEKLSKVEQLAPRVQRLDVALSHESNPRQAQKCKRVEITVRAKGPVIRAEACAEDPYVALDLAQEKLIERLRRARDRKKVHPGRQLPTIREAGVSPGAPALNGTGPLGVGADSGAESSDATEDEGPFADSPVVIREKVHTARPMSLDDALYEMELVGHDFYLFIDAPTGAPSVVYRRKGWNYGVIRLVEDESVIDLEGAATGGAAAGADAAATGASAASAQAAGAR
ncbi:MAG TPA: ribosome-associated translation inhibitor RaiA [Actinomycetales bacterium]|nr:ribosome-associated translation inhibitor RaiA [Actinomycetales bacterium]